jgi:hypothetical protein
MQYITITGTDLRVSRIRLGTWSVGGWMWGGSDDGSAKTESASTSVLYTNLVLRISNLRVRKAYGSGSLSRLYSSNSLEG